MKTYLLLSLAAAAFVAISSAAGIKRGPIIGERPEESREEEREDTLALAGEDHGEIINDANQHIR